MATFRHIFILSLSISILGLAAGNACAAEQPLHIRTSPGEPEMERQAQKYLGDYYLDEPSEQKVIALTFDDGPSQYTREVLKILKEFDVKATFFCTGQNLERHPEIVREALAQGHTIGNHSYSHPHSKTLTTDKFWNDEIVRTQKIFKKEIGFEPALFRPPYGELNDEEIEKLKAGGIKIIGWSIDPKDWSMPDEQDTAATIVTVVSTHVHRGAIVLMHDGMHGHGLNTIRALRRLIPILKSQGYVFDTVDHLIAQPAVLPN